MARAVENMGASMNRYQVIYADPPWDVKKIKRDVRPNQVEMEYPTMSLSEIKNLGIDLRQYEAEDCKLFLWTTQAYLPHSFSVMEEWGFKYQRVITWDKGNGMCLFGFHHRTEFLLFGYRGKIEMYPHQKAFPTIVSAKSERHSEKPQIFRDLIAPFGEPRIELFARKKVAGWDCWGNEVESDINIGNQTQCKKCNGSGIEYYLPVSELGQTSERHTCDICHGTGLAPIGSWGVQKEGEGTK